MAAALVAVSILTRPGGRVLPARSVWTVMRYSSFQSSPGPGAGCCRIPEYSCQRRTSSFNPHPARGPGAAWSLRVWWCGRTGFNPHPARGPGAAWPPLTHDCGPVPVSILTRPGGRVLRIPILTRPGGRVLLSREVSPASQFQSSPGPGAGCCRFRTRVHIELDDRRFNPHPARGPGAALGSRRGLPAGLLRFNPHPARGPGAAGVKLQRRRPDRQLVVSILTRPGGRVLPCGAYSGGFRSLISHRISARDAPGVVLVRRSRRIAGQCALI